MFIAYYDESGDDGFPETSSPFFVLSVVYQHHLVWKENYAEVKEFKRQLARDFSFPFHEELHTREFLLNKNPYFNWKMADADRVHVIDLYCQLCAQTEPQNNQCRHREVAHPSGLPVRRAGHSAHLLRATHRE
jgi:hypothetical protein